jgi:hypothetical protein
MGLDLSAFIEEERAQRRMRDATNRLLRDWHSKPDISASCVAAELRRRRRDHAARWPHLEAFVAAHLRRRWGPR